MKTFEEYQEFVKNKPEPSGESVYRLTAVETDAHLPERGMKRYPKYEVSIPYKLLYFTREDAENKIVKLVEASKRQKDTIPLCYIIDRLPVNGSDFEEECCGRIISWWLYDEAGQMIDHSFDSELLCHTGSIYSAFLGRDDCDMRFHKGDIAEVLNLRDKTISLYIVAEDDLSIKDTWMRYEKMIRQTPEERAANHWTIDDFWAEYFIDFLDDSYPLIDSPDYLRSHIHVSPRLLLAPHFPIPARTRTRLTRSLDLLHIYSQTTAIPREGWLPRKERNQIV